MIRIRIAKPEDAETLLEIYRYYVLNTAITMEVTPPDTAEFQRRIRVTGMNYPWLVAEDDGTVVGYAYINSFHTREAYRHAAEISVYVAKEERHKGIGGRLYTALEDIARLQNVYTLHACIVKPDGPDAYVTNASCDFHTAMGYRMEGCHEHCAYKFGTWYSVVWMGKRLTDLPEKPEAFVPFPEIRVNEDTGYREGYRVMI